MISSMFMTLYATSKTAVQRLHMSFVFFFRSCGVVCEAFYSLKNAQGSGRGSFAEGCPSRKVAEGDVGKIQRIE